MTRASQFLIFSLILGALSGCGGLQDQASVSDELYAPRKASYNPPPRKQAQTQAQEDQYREYEEGQYSKNEGEEDTGERYYDADNGGFCGSCIQSRRFFYDPFWNYGWGWGGMGWGMGMGWGFGGGWGIGMGWGLGGGWGWYDPFWNNGWGMGWGGWGWGTPWMNPYWAYNQGFWTGYYAGSGIWNHETNGPNRYYGHRGSVLSSNTNQYAGGGGRSGGSGGGNRVGTGNTTSDNTRYGRGGTVESGRSSGNTRTTGVNDNRSGGNTGAVRQGGGTFSNPRTVDPYDGTRSGGNTEIGPGRTRDNYNSRVPSANDYRNSGGAGRYNNGTPGVNRNPSGTSRSGQTVTPSRPQMESGRGQNQNTQRTSPGQYRSTTPSHSPQPSYSPAPRSGGSMGSWGGNSGGSGGFGGSGGGGRSGGGGGGGSAPRGPR